MACALVAATALVAGACSSDTDSSAAGTACAEVTAAPAPGEHTITVDGLDRTYLLALPDGIGRDEPKPLLFDLHGFGSPASVQDGFTELSTRGTERGYIVVTPQGAPIDIPEGIPGIGNAADFEGFPFWNFFGSSGVDFGGEPPPDSPIASVLVDPESLGADDVAFLGTLLDSLSTSLCVDPARVYSTGLSNGAGMSTTLACELGDRIAAIAPVSGVNLSGACPGDDPMSVLAIHGTGDTIVDYEGGELMGFELGNPSVAGRMAAWAEHDGCDPEPTTTTPSPAVTVTTWTGCADGTDVELWTLDGWIHAWPTPGIPQNPDDVDATGLVLDFFDAHRRA